MSTTTPRLGLTKPASSEAYDIAIANANMDLIDAGPANVTVCTSTTRPTTPDEGDLIYETDSNLMLVRQSSAWKSFVTKIFLCTSSTRPASSLTVGGMVIFETDTVRLYVRNSSNTSWLSTTTAPTVQVFTVSGTWNKPTGCIGITVDVVGGGGSGGGTAATGVGQVAGSGGGGGGGYARKTFAESVLAASETVTVATGGAGAAAGNNGGSFGGDSIFAVGKAYAVTGGGGGGGGGGFVASAGTIAGGTGGSPGGGDLNAQGSDGGPATIPSATVLLGTMNGGASAWGGEAKAPTASGTGTAGKNYGGGSSGSGNFIASQGVKASTAGGPGIVIVTHYFA